MLLSASDEDHNCIMITTPLHTIPDDAFRDGREQEYNHRLIDLYGLHAILRNI
jgi:hypothetical protein